MEYDYSKLKGRIIEVYETQGNFANAMGKTQETLSKKLNNIRRFDQNEITLAIQLLNISPEDINSYFFKQKVQ